MSLDPNGIAYRDEILDALWKIGKVTRPIDADKQGIYADALESEKLTRAQVGDMVRGCVKTLRIGFFPTPAKLIDFARPPAINAPSSDARPFDPIASFEREIEVQTEWLRKFELRGDEFHARCARVAIERAQIGINERRKHRGSPARYVAAGVEDFGAAAAGDKQADFHDWTHDSEDS